MTLLGQIILNKRRELDITQAELARRLGVHASYLSTIERGSKSPNKQAFLKLIASSLNMKEIETQDLVDAARISQRTLRLPSTVSGMGYKVVDRIVSLLQDLSEDDLQDLDKMLDILASRAYRTPSAKKQEEKM